MAKFNLDYSGLANTITKKAYRLADVKDQLETVGFDIVRFRSGDKGAELWQVNHAEDGDYIVALYEDEVLDKTASVWGVVATKNGSDLQISYKGDPLLRMSAAKLGIPASELHQAEKYLPEKLATNKKLVKALLNQLSATAKQVVSQRYPELV